MAQAQAVVSEIDGNSLERLDRGLELIQSAETTCQALRKDKELAELRAARERLASHRTLLVEREERKKGANLSAEQLESYLKSGDPNCPKGQAYSHKPSGKEIRCTGLRPAEMPRVMAEKYFKGKGLRSIQGKPREVLAMEAGAERYLFFYRETSGNAPPYCMVLYPKPGISWQEAVSRITGVSPDHLKPAGNVTVSGVALPILLDERQTIIRLGACPNPLP